MTQPMDKATMDARLLEDPDVKKLLVEVKHVEDLFMGGELDFTLGNLRRAAGLLRTMANGFELVASKMEALSGSQGG